MLVKENIEILKLKRIIFEESLFSLFDDRRSKKRKKKLKVEKRKKRGFRRYYSCSDDSFEDDFRKLSR